MKHLATYLVEKLQPMFEGGHAVAASPIPSHLSMGLYKDVEELLIKTDRSLKGHIAVLGSVGKKKQGDFNGDIDVAVEYDRSKFEIALNKALPDVERATASMPNIISINYPYEDKNTTYYAQVDFMIVDDLEWAEFIYKSPDFTKDESHYKAAFRNHLLSIMISEVPVEELPDLDDDGNVKSKWKHSLNFAFGVTKQFLDYQGKNGLLKNPKKIKELEKEVTRNKQQFIEFLLDGGNNDDFNSLESVWKALHDKYKYQDKVKTIEDRFFDEVLDKNGLDKKEFLNYVQ